MSYKLYYDNGTAAMGIRVLLEEIGAPYELIQTTTDMQTPRPIEQLKLNPNGWIPILIWDGNSMYECAAIAIFLCDRHPEAKLAPAYDEIERGRFLQTLVYFSSSIQNAFQLDYYPDRFTDTTSCESSAQRRSHRRSGAGQGSQHEWPGRWHVASGPKDGSQRVAPGGHRAFVPD